MNGTKKNTTTTDIIMSSTYDMTIIDEDIADNVLLSFISMREGLPRIVEENRIRSIMKSYRNRLLGAAVPTEQLGTLRRLLMQKYFNELATPGDCVGVACAQSIGECITQSTLNTFHAAGMDTGIVTTMRKIEDIINLPKTGVSQVKLYPADRSWTLRQFYLKTRHYVEQIRLSDLIVAFDTVGDDVVLRLQLYKLFRYRITRSMLLESVAEIGTNVRMLDYIQLDETSTTINCTVCVASSGNRMLTRHGMMKKFTNIHVTGVVGASPPHRFVRTGTSMNEWCVECNSKSIRNFTNTHHVYDALRTTTNRLRDIETCYGIESSRNTIIEMSKSCLSESVSDATVQLLASILTLSGHVEPFTRFTMRSNRSPLAKIGFEECLEGCRNAGLYCEKEEFKTISSSIMSGILPRVGTNYTRIKVDISNLLNEERQRAQDWCDHDDYNLVHSPSRTPDTIKIVSANTPDDGML